MMKVVSKLLIVLMFVVPFVGCSDDDDKEKAEVDFAKEIEGSYSGALTISPLAEEPIPDVVIVVEHKSTNIVTLKLNQVLIPEVAEVDIQGNVNVSKDNDNYKVNGTISSFELNGETVESNVSVSGTIDKDGKASLTIGLSIEEMGPLAVTFAGEKTQE